jgi:hypothetical protein
MILRIQLLPGQTLRRIYGSDEFLNGIERWCIWIDDSELGSALAIPPIRERIDRTRIFRIGGGDVARGLANRPHKFRYTHTAKNTQIIIPRVSSERRTYIPFGFLGPKDVVSDAAQVIYDPQPWSAEIESWAYNPISEETVRGKVG